MVPRGGGYNDIGFGGGYGTRFTVCNLKIELGFTDGPINTQKAEDNPTAHIGVRSITS